MRREFRANRHRKQHGRLRGCCGLVLSLALAAPLHARAEASAAIPILVNSELPGTSGRDDSLTLRDALERAVADPRDNVIRFDLPPGSGGAVAICLVRGFAIDDARGGHDRIDATGSNPPIVIDLTACEDAGFVIAGRARLDLVGLTLRGGRQRAVLARDQARVILNRCHITASKGPGIALFGESAAELHHTRLSANRTHAIECHGTTRATLDECVLENNGQSAVAAFDQADLRLRACRLRANGDWNLVLTEAARAAADGCVLDSSRFANVDISGTSRISLDGCRLEDGRRFGIFATEQARASVRNSHLSRHRGRGIELQQQAVLSLHASTIEASGEYGLILFGDASVDAKTTAFTGNGAHGASLRGRAGGQFTGCSFVANHYSGIGCLDGSDGGTMHATRCTFTRNGMRPVYRGPLHLDPLVPTPLRIEGSRVTCLTEPHATVELYLDRAGEAAHFLKTVPADDRGRFHVDGSEVPEGWVMTATAISGGQTSEFNVVAGTAAGPILNALLGNTGPLSDQGGDIDRTMILRRWRPGTRLVFHLTNPPTEDVRSYLNYVVERMDDWAGGTLDAELRCGPNRPGRDAAVVPIRYVDPDSSQLLGRGGVTFMRWDAQGHFISPMEILVARGRQIEDTCPRVLAHEVGHTLGLCHARVGLLSRMQGSTPPAARYVNDFSPTLTYYDVLALQVLHDTRNARIRTIGQLVERGTLPASDVRLAELAGPAAPVLEPTFSPAAPDAPPREAEAPR